MAFDSTGYTATTSAEFILQMKQDIESRLGHEIDVSTGSVFNEIIGVVSEALGNISSDIQSLYDARSVIAAEGITLDNIGGMVATYRGRGSSSSVVLTLSTTGGSAVIPSGSRFKNQNSEVFETTSDHTVPGDITLFSVDVGSYDVSTGASWDPLTIVSGVNYSAVVQAENGVSGYGVESDSDYRLRILTAPDSVGASTPESITSSVLQIESVQDVVVIENVSLSTVDGIPGKAFHTIVYPPTADGAAIADAIMTFKPAGIEAYGQEQVVIDIENAGEQTVGFSFAAQRSVDVNVVLEYKSSGVYSGDSSVESAISTALSGLGINDDVRVWRIHDQIGDETSGIEALSVSLSVGGSSGLQRVIVNDNSVPVLGTVTISSSEE